MTVTLLQVSNEDVSVYEFTPLMVDKENFDIEECKKIIPFDKYTNRQRIKIINHIVASIYDYQKYLKYENN